MLMSYNHKHIQNGKVRIMNPLENCYYASAMKVIISNCS